MNTWESASRSLTVKYVPDWFPGAGFKRQAKKWRVLAMDMVEKPFEHTKRDMVRVGSLQVKEKLTHFSSMQARGTAAPSFTSLSLQDLAAGDNNAYQEGLIKSTAGTIYTGIHDTLRRHCFSLTSNCSWL